ncbi:DUF4367 domain-containing protein [Clostridium autoethanogenum]|uniref:DUF4367 domain-containing protein n=2 Tax=Clostridium autoethanogenum TaxID=84023 RepID=A0A3M0SSA1_9CLOT|nr:DUF4367 domain-containing protein [Clostridium autoethanogenum]AGY77882.1 DUF4367 domain-containing protein [Clostridium autoethanogenum DSM 10061]ALU38016.1 hypothetical protein CLAU_3589 [Clostridium autoethanogenum DSM 10061]OVY50780.1 hypothetical protein WX72_01941 [Clostridium autoethanogenum]RMD01274.1 DUF4367 domain-containing protein [Clostridium autoethanogenum]
MNKKNIEDKFSVNMDAYLNGIQNVDESNSEEFNELLEIGKTLANKDFSENSNKEAVFNKTLKNINEYNGDNIMKKSNRIKKTVAAAAVFLVVGGVFTQTSFAKGLAEKVINRISLGHITAEQIQEPSQVVIPTDLKGKIFDKNKNPVTVVTKNTGKLYTKSGEEIATILNGKIVTVSEAKAEDEKIQNNMLIVKNSSSLNKYTCFDVKLPSYLPEGYKFDRAEFYKDNDGSVSKEYIDLYFTNAKTGKYISMNQRFASKKTKYEDGTDGKMEKVKVNGKDAILFDNRNMDWENNGVLYSLSGRGAFGKTELIKIADSIK